MYNEDIKNFVNRYKVPDNNELSKNKVSDNYREKQKKRKIKRKEQKERQERRLRGRIISLLMAGILVIGGYNISKANETNVELTLTLEEALKSGKNLEYLGIDEFIRREISQIRDELDNKELSNSELIALSTRIYQLQYDTLTTKLSNVLNLDESKIKISIKEVEPYEKIQLIKAGNEVYSNSRLFKSENIISKEVEDYINHICETKKFMVNIEHENFNREDIYSYYQSTIKYIEEFAVVEMYVNDKGNILTGKTTGKNFSEIEYNGNER